MQDINKHESVSLAAAVLLLETPQEVDNFLKDLCTPNEINTLRERWRVCQLLAAHQLSYREIHQVTGASLTTISRVARFLKDETNNGYLQLLTKIKRESKKKNE